MGKRAHNKVRDVVPDEETPYSIEIRIETSTNRKALILTQE